MTKKKKTIFLIIIIIALLAITAGILVYFGLNKNEITIKYMVNGSWIELSLDKDSKVGDIKQPDKITGYTFSGWYKDPALTLEATSNEVLIDGSQYYAKFTPNTYKVMFYSNLNDGKVIELETLFNTDYTIIEKPDDFINTGYSFVGWSNSRFATWDEESSLILENETKTLKTEGIRYYAVWKGETIINVNFDKSDMEYDIDMSLDKPVVYYGDKVTLPSFEQSVIDYISKIDDPLVKFGGFIVNGTEYNAGETIKNIIEDLEIKIKWVKVDSYLKFDLNLSSMIDNENYSGNKPDTMVIKQNFPTYSFSKLPALTGKFTNYTFKNWNTKSDGTGESYSVNSTFTTKEQENTLYAVWQGKKRIVKFDTSDATFNGSLYLINDIVSNYGNKIVFPKVVEKINQNNNTAFIFGGFKLNDNIYMPGEELLLDTALEEITFTINWVAAPVYSRLQFSLNLPAGETTSQITPEIITKNSEQSLYVYNNLPTLQDLTNYTFKHWNTKSDGTGFNHKGGETFSTTLADNILYAIWEGNELNVTLNTSDIIYSSDVTENQKIKLDETQKAIYGKSYTLPSVSQDLIEKISNSNQSLILTKFGGFIVNGTEYNAGETINNLNNDLSIIVKWVSVDSYLKFDLNLSSMIGNETYDSTLSPLPQVKKQNATSYSYINLPTLDNSQLNNYIFKNWNTSRDGTGTSYGENDTFTTTSSENILYAVYEGKSRVVSLMYGEIELNRISTNFGKTINLEAVYPLDKPQAEYEFNGYYDNSALTGNKLIGSYLINFTEEIKVLYASFEEVGITLEFNANGGNGSYNNLFVKPTNNSYTFTEEEKEALTSALTWNLHILQGFALSQTATVGAWTISLAGVTSKSVTLYAVWEIDKTQITTAGIEAGVFPQTYVGYELNGILKSATLTETGKTYTTDIDNKSTILKEYLYDGKKYVKVPSAKPWKSSGCAFSNNASIAEGATYFFEVEPIKWDVIEDDGKFIAVTKNLLGSNMFARNSTDWEYSNLRSYFKDRFVVEAGLTSYLKQVTHYTSTYSSDVKGKVVTDSVWAPTYLKIQKYYTSSTTRQKQVTDFARATNTYYDYAVFTGYYYLRSAGSTANGCVVDPKGNLNYNSLSAFHSYYGICPAFVLAI